MAAYTDALGAAMVRQAIGEHATVHALQVVREEAIACTRVDTIVRIVSSHNAANVLRSPTHMGRRAVPGDTLTKEVDLNNLVSGIVFEAADGTPLRQNKAKQGKHEPNFMC